MPTDTADLFGLEQYRSAADLPGGGLDVLRGENLGSLGQPFGSRGLSVVQQAQIQQLRDQGWRIATDNEGNTTAFNPIHSNGQTAVRYFEVGAPRRGVRGLANKEYNKAFAALSAYSALYPQTIALTRRAAADYGDIYRRASNESLQHQLLTQNVLRGGDISDFAKLGPQYVSTLRATNPQLAALYDTTQQDLALGDRLSPSQLRNIQQSVRAGQAARGMGMGPTDVYEEAIQTSGYGDALRQQRIQNAMGAQGLYGDVFQATTGRPALAPPPQGFNVNGYNPAIDPNDLLSYGVNQEIQHQNLGAAENAANKALYGSIIKGVGSIAGGALACWLAREAYGERNPQWLRFRHWLFTHGPRPLLRQYLRLAPLAAQWLRRHPTHKPAVRAIMDKLLAPRASRLAPQLP